MLMQMRLQLFRKKLVSGTGRALIPKVTKVTEALSVI
jgi:hypothetical protein